MNMNLKIEMIDKNPKKRWDFVNVKAQIQINDFVEDLYLPLDWWNSNNYEQQWKEGLKRLVNHDTSCFVVGIHNPKLWKFIEWWPLYKIDNKIYIRNQIILNDIYEEQIGDKPFTINTCYDFVPKRGASHDDEGQKISEWVIDCDE